MKDNKQLNQEEYLKYIEKWKLENKDLIDSGKCKKVFLENLPKGNNQGKISIDWKNCNNYYVCFIYEDIEGYIEIINYDKDKHQLCIMYNNNKYTILTNDLRKCALGNILNKITNKFKIKMGTKFQDGKRNLTIIDKEYRYDKNNRQWKWYKYVCKVCGYKGWSTEYNLYKGQNCSCCENISILEGYNDIPTTAPWMVKYFQGGYDEAKLYTKTSNQKIYPICPDCGRVKKKKMVIYNLFYYKSIACSCSDGYSYPNRFMHLMLEQLKVKYKAEKSFKWCKFSIKKINKTGRYDFYFKLNNKEYIIEMDGGFHKKDNEISGQSKEESQLIDYEKDRLAKEHGIEVIRINCNYGQLENRFEHIKQNILKNEKINRIFNLNRVEWELLKRMVTSNLVKVICEFKNNNPNMTTKDISENFKLCRSLVTKYLNIGSEFGWCNYNGKEEMSKSAKKSNRNGKLVEIFKDDNSKGVYLSVHELDRKSLNDFGIKLDYRNISAVCNGKRKMYKGFIFKYISDLTEEEIKQIQENAKLNQAI